MSTLDDAKAALKAPAQGLTWLQLAAATVFVIVVAFAWRQVTHFIMGEI
jgi:hypothetical protein